MTGTLHVEDSRALASWARPPHSLVPMPPRGNEHFGMKIPPSLKQTVILSAARRAESKACPELAEGNLCDTMGTPPGIERREMLRVQKRPGSTHFT